MPRVTCAIILLFFVSCNTETSVRSLDELVIRLDSEPTSIHPMLSSVSLDRQVHEYIYLSLGDFHPKTLEMIPVLLEELPEVETVEDMPGHSIYRMLLKPDALWADGTPITGEDVAWTIKIALHPEVNNPGWKQLLKDVKSIEVDAQDPKRLSITIEDDYFLTKDALLTAEIFSKNFHDPDGVLDDYSVADIKDLATASITSDLSEVAQRFASTTYTKERENGSGPYRLESWETGQYLSLIQKSDYWGEAYRDNPFLRSNPNRLIFQIIPDNTVAVTLLKSDEVDFLDMMSQTYVAYDDLKKTEDEDLDFYQMDIPRYYFLALNNDDVRLSDVRVRRALQHITDVDRIIRQAEGGYGTRLAAPIHPSRPEYNDGLKPVTYDVDLARELLDAAGWIDSDGDGIRDRLIGGVSVPMSLRLFGTGSALGKTITNIITEDAAKLGIEIVAINKPYRDLVRTHLRTGDFEMGTLLIT
ncbi:MAG: ABC transporter substrate-binding protein, partial [Bacteroidota bacterium]